MSDLEKALIAYADQSYCLGIEALRQEGCLGWEQKVKSGEFGQAEMDAHKRADRHFGAHFGIYAALRAIRP